MSTDPAVPKALGRYAISRRLGAGGMAEVFLAKSKGAEGVEKVLVVKRVLPSFARSEKFISMFLEEAKIATRLNHPNIVQVYAFEQVEKEFLLAMEFVDGRDLGALIESLRQREEPFPFGFAAMIVMEVGKGLDYAHKRRDENGEPMEIVHRDVSPQNVLISYDGIVKVADFGIAKARMVSEDTGVIKGKFAYMSPEQARGESVDCRSDVYSLGILLAELLMGRPMYPGQHGLDVLEKVRNGEMTFPETVRPDVPEGLAAIVRRATAVDREERYQTARSLAGALGQYLHMLDEVHDFAYLEQFVARVAPRSQSTFPGHDTATTVASGIGTGNREMRERRHVVVVSGHVHDHPGDDDGSNVTKEIRRVLSHIAFKNEAVLTWPKEPSSSEFRLIFGVRRASVHDPLSAVRLAMDVVEAFDGLSADTLVPVSATLALSRGILATVTDGEGRLLRYEPVGSVLEVARSLADQGTPGEILATGEVFRLVRRVYAFDETNLREIRTTGTTSTTLRAYVLRGGRTREERAADAQAHSTHLVGREDSLSGIRQAYVAAQSSERSQYLSVTGELGAGKTALVSAAIASFSGSPRLLHAEAVFGTSNVPYAVVTDLVRDALSISEEWSSERALEKLESETRKLFNEDWRTAYDGLLPLVAKVSTSEAAPHANLIRDSVRRVLGALAKNGPVVVWVDALQWADGPSVELMASFIRETYEAPLLAVFSSRRTPRIDRVFSAVPSIELADLSPDECRRLVRRRFDDAMVPLDFEEEIIRRAGGNPFFIIELIEALVDRNAVWTEVRDGVNCVVRKPGVPLALPTTLEGVISARLDELPEPERYVLRWLSVAGPGYDVAQLSQLSGVETQDALTAATKRGLVHRVSGGFDFVSAVIRHVAYDTTDPRERLRMHRRMGGWLSRPEVPAPLARVARHLEIAGSRAEAGAAYFQAAADARSVYSLKDSLRFYHKALLLLPNASPKRFEAHRARAEILRGLGRPAESLGELRRMREIADLAESPELIAVAYTALAQFELEELNVEAAEQLLPVALAAAREVGDLKSEVGALRLSGVYARDMAEVADAIAHCEEALARCGSTEALLSTRAEVLGTFSSILRLAGRHQEALEAIVEAFVIFRRQKMRHEESSALGAMTVCLASMGKWQDALTVAQTSIAIDRETGYRVQLGRKLSNAGQLLGELGDFDRAMEFLLRAETIFPRIGDELGRPDALSALADLMIEQRGDLDEAASYLDRARRGAEKSGDRYDWARERTVRARLGLARGNHDAAEEAAREALAVAEEGGVIVYATLAKAVLLDILVAARKLQDVPVLAGELFESLSSETEQAEHVHLSVARALQASSDTRADAAQAQAVKLVQERLGALENDVAKERYLSRPVVVRIRRSASEPGA